MKLRLFDIKSAFWDKFHHTIRDYGGCSTCGPFSTEVMDQEEFEALLEEIDSWIKENYGS